MIIFRVGDWVQRKEEDTHGTWLRKTENRARHPHLVIGIREINGFLYLDGLPLSWSPSCFYKVSSPHIKFNLDDYL